MACWCSSRCLHWRSHWCLMSVALLAVKLLCRSCYQLGVSLLHTGILQEDTAVNVEHILSRGKSPTSGGPQEDLWLCMHWWGAGSVPAGWWEISCDFPTCDVGFAIDCFFGVVLLPLFCIVLQNVLLGTKYWIALGGLTNHTQSMWALASPE